MAHCVNGELEIGDVDEDDIKMTPGSRDAMNKDAANDEDSIQALDTRGIQAQSTPRPSTRSKDERRLRALLKAFFFRHAKWENSTCYINTVYLIIFVIQIVKLAFLTKQMIAFRLDRENFGNIVQSGHLTFRHLLLEGWDAGWETAPYPPARGDFAVYTMNSLKKSIDFAVSQYYNAEKDAIGYYRRLHSDNMQATVKYFDFLGSQDAEDDKRIDINEKHFPIEHGLTSTQTENGTVYTYSIHDELEFRNLSQSMKHMLEFSLKFTIHSLKPNKNSGHALCLLVEGEVNFADVDNNGQVLVDLHTLTSKINCQTMNISAEDLCLEYTKTLISKIVLGFGILSVVMTVISFVLGVYVCYRTRSYMSEIENETKIPNSEYCKFISQMFWDIIAGVSDGFTLSGTNWILHNSKDQMWDVSMLDNYTIKLGVGCILAWMSILGYLKIHYKFSLLFKTMYRAFWDVMTYLICATVLFVGFLLFGYVVLGQYNVKFQSMSSATETLFGLVNGDEIFATFALFEENQTGDKSIAVCAAVYIGVYVFVFTIVAINLLVALFLGAYETIQDETKDRRQGSLKIAIQDAIRQPDAKCEQLRSTLIDLLSSDDKHPQVSTLRDELRKFIKINETSRKLESVKQTTLNSFIRDDSDEERKEERKKECNCCKISLPWSWPCKYFACLVSCKKEPSQNDGTSVQGP